MGYPEEIFFDSRRIPLYNSHWGFCQFSNAGVNGRNWRAAEARGLHGEVLAHLSREKAALSSARVNERRCEGRCLEMDTTFSLLHQGRKLTGIISLGANPAHNQKELARLRKRADTLLSISKNRGKKSLTLG